MTKLIALTAGVVALIVIALAVYFPAREMADLDREQTVRASTFYGALLSSRLGHAVRTSDVAAATEQLAPLTRDPDVTAIALLAATGRTLYYHGDTSALARAGAITEPQVIREDDRVAVLTPIEGGALMIELRSARRGEYLQSLKLTALGVGAAMIAFGALAAYAIARPMVRRLRRMVEIASEVSHDSVRMVPVDRADEIGALAEAFNRMLLRLHADRARLHQTVADLSATEEQLARTNRDLEHRVVARTTALSDANRQLELEMKNRSAIEVELRQAQKLESVGRLASGIAHEINTPVQFVSDSCAFLETASQDLVAIVAHYRSLFEAIERQKLTAGAALERSRAIDAEYDFPYLSEQIPAAIDRSIQGLARVTAIVRAMKEFAYPDRHEQAPADLNRAITSTVTVARNEYKYVAELETDFAELPVVTCHVGELNQVVLNIVVNAAHAIEAKPRDGQLGKIIVRTRTAPRDRVQIIIEDNGCGIPDAVIEKIFDPFFTTKEIGKGSGQGLAIARTVVVDKHHGKLDVASRPGEGTTFTITLPVYGVPHARGTTRSPPLRVDELGAISVEP